MSHQRARQRNQTLRLCTAETIPSSGQEMGWGRRQPDCGLNTEWDRPVRDLRLLVFPEAIYAKQSQFSAGARQRARGGKSPRRCRRARACETKPICGSGKARISDVLIKTCDEPDTPEASAKQSQSSSLARGVFQGISKITPHGVTTNAGPSVRNKANSQRCRLGRGPGDGSRGGRPRPSPPAASGRPWAGCAKQTQFLGARCPILPLFQSHILSVRWEIASLRSQ